MYYKIVCLLNIALGIILILFILDLFFFNYFIDLSVLGPLVAIVFFFPIFLLIVPLFIIIFSLLTIRTSILGLKTYNENIFVIFIIFLVPIIFNLVFTVFTPFLK